MPQRASGGRWPNKGTEVGAALLLGLSKCNRMVWRAAAKIVQFENMFLRNAIKARRSFIRKQSGFRFALNRISSRARRRGISARHSRGEWLGE